MLKKLLFTFFFVLRIPYLAISYIYIIINFYRRDRYEIKNDQEFFNLLRDRFIEHYDNTMKHSIILSLIFWIIIYYLIF